MGTLFFFETIPYFCTMQQSIYITIAIDGYSSCGKSTLAKALAEKLGFVFIDSGAMYRAVTLYCLRHDLIKDAKVDLEKIENSLANINLKFKFNQSTDKSDMYLNNENVEELIRLPDVAANVSIISTIKSVRKKLVKEQRKISQNTSIVMDGRDIGSVVFPNADIKFFITASQQIRTERRLKELTSKDIQITYDEVLKNIQERDHLDSTREESPLIKTSDAILIDTTHLTPEQQLSIALNYTSELLQKEHK
jgi:cytidylate kinase